MKCEILVGVTHRILSAIPSLRFGHSSLRNVGTGFCRDETMGGGGENARLLI